MCYWIFMSIGYYAKQHSIAKKDLFFELCLLQSPVLCSVSWSLFRNVSIIYLLRSMWFDSHIVLRLLKFPKSIKGFDSCCMIWFRSWSSRLVLSGTLILRIHSGFLSWIRTPKILRDGIEFGFLCFWWCLWCTFRDHH